MYQRQLKTLRKPDGISTGKLPTGRRHLGNALLIDGQWIFLAKLELELFALLFNHPRSIFNGRAVANYIYGDREDGGPTYVRESVSQLALRLRRKLNSTRFRLRSKHKHGYWLVRV